MKLRKYTLDELKEAIKTSVSVRQCLEKLNIIPAGGNYSTFHKAVKHFSLDTSHFTGQNHTGRTFPKRRQHISEYLVNKPTQSHSLRKYLIDAGVFTHICSSCKLSEWLSEPIPLELDHIDGCHSNNVLSNLRLLCPNCHAKTPTYRRGKKSLLK